MAEVECVSDNMESGLVDDPRTWEVLSRRSVYESWWVELHIASVRLNDGRVIDHEIVVAPEGAAGMVAINEHDEILMIYRHRFISDTWGWELPAGRIEPGEAPRDGAIRECLEETGYAVADVTPLTSWHPSSGFSDQRFHAFLARSVESMTEPTEVNEAMEIAWRPADDVAADLLDGRIPDGFTQMAMMWAFSEMGWPLDRDRQTGIRREKSGT
jgi:8-oxo-dGTP pyrophosphatase MutT (NUDIX family)